MKSIIKTVEIILNNLYKTIYRHKKSSIILIIVILLGLIFFIPNTFAILTPVKEIELYSQKLSYQDKTPGAWKVTKSAKWASVHEAEITFNVDSILKSNNTQRDVILVLDTSGSMAGDKLSRVKLDATELVENLLEDANDKVALITFNTSSQIDSGFTNDKTSLIDKINSLEADGTTNYYQALVNVDSLLKNYTKEEGRECIVLFLTDGYPCEDTPNEVGEYQYLKDQYSYIFLNAIQYEMGVNITDEIKNISDNQFMADMKTLNNVLFDASVVPVAYNNFKITDYINTDYFIVEDESNIKVSQGKISFDKTNQKIEWTFNYKAGYKATMTIRAKLKENLSTSEKIYPTNTKEEVSYSIEDVEETITSTDTPILAENYKVIYDTNAPDGCTVENAPESEIQPVFKTVALSETIPRCNGYQFKGWETKADNVKMLNDSYFIMPENDVEIKGTWTKIGIKKSMDGTISKRHTLYKQIEQDVNDSTKYAKKYTGSTDTFQGNQNVYLYYGAAKNNNAIFANYCWKIVRTTDTGGVKLLYNGTPVAGKCTNTETASQLTAAQMNLSGSYVAYNANSNSSPADVGYMYNTRHILQSRSNLSVGMVFGNSFTYSGGSYTLSNTVSITTSTTRDSLSNYHYTCWNTTGKCTAVSYLYLWADAFYYVNLTGGKSMDTAMNEMLYNSNINVKSSTIKTAVDYWYSKNMTSYTPYLEDTVFCNDRSVRNSNENGWNPNGGNMGIVQYFTSSTNLYNYTCKNKNDRFTTSTANGNGALTYPVGLLTFQEQYSAYVSETSPLTSGDVFWTMSPNFYYTGTSVVRAVQTNGNYVNGSVTSTAGVRPVVSLRPDMEYSKGDGSVDSPYVVITD